MTKVTFHVDGAAVGGGDAVCDRQTQARTTRFTRAGRIDAIEPFEEVG